MASLTRRSIAGHLRNVPERLLELSPFRAEQVVVDVLRETLGAEVRKVGGVKQIAALLDKRPDVVRNLLTSMRQQRLVDVVAIGRLEGHVTTAASYWRLTDAGREELARRRSG